MFKLLLHEPVELSMLVPAEVFQAHTHTHTDSKTISDSRLSVTGLGSERMYSLKYVSLPLVVSFPRVSNHLPLFS